MHVSARSASFLKELGTSVLTRVLTVKQLASFRAGCDGHRGPFVFDVKLTVRIACKTTRPLERSVGGSSGGAAAAVAAASSQRPREATARLDPHPGIVLRPLRPQANARAHAARSAGRRKLGQHGRRPRPHPQRPRQCRAARREPWPGARRPKRRPCDETTVMERSEKAAWRPEHLSSYNDPERRPPTFVVVSESRN